MDLEADTATVKNAVDAQLFDTYANKHWGISFAANAAITVLRVDQIIMAKQAGGPKSRAPGPQDEDD